MTKYVGVDVSKTSATVHVLEDRPNNLKLASRRAKTMKINADAEGIEQLASLGDVFILEPTGDYSRIWDFQLTRLDKTVLIVAPRRVAYLRLYHGCESKSDRNDAFFLALYGLENGNSPDAFLAPHAEEIRAQYLRRKYLEKVCGIMVNRLWQLLSFQWPEVCITAKGKKPCTQRAYLEDKPYGLWLYLAGRPLRLKKFYECRLEGSIGTGLDDLSRFLAAQICDLEDQAYCCEQQISVLLSSPDFDPYHQVFERFGFGSLTRAALLSRIYPFERFLGVDGRPVVEYVLGPKSERSNGRTKRRRSEAAFKLSLGLGRVIYQSGDEHKERKGGPKYARSALYQHISAVLIMRPKAALNSTLPLVKAHAEYYHGLSGDIPHKRRVMKTASRIVRDLFKELINLP